MTGALEDERKKTREIPAGRDLTLDLARVSCVLLVVLVHVLFAGVGRAADGSLVIERTVEAEPWFEPASWIADVMPLFFVVGGFAARAGWRSTLARGGDADAFVRIRLVRLARPALPLFVFLALALAVVRLLDIDPALVGAVAIGVGSPLWFLAAYMIVQALAPVMIRLHERTPVRVLLALLTAVVLVDVLRFGVGRGLLGLASVVPGSYGAGEELLGIPNVAFVWLFAQQIGFWMAEGWFLRRRLWQNAVLLVVGYAAIAGATLATGAYSWNMLANQWPPTLPMAILAVVQAAALTMLHRPLTALMRTRAAQGLVFVAGSRLMTVYLWHLPVIMALIGVQLLLPLALPQPGGAVWWWTRIPFLLLVLAVVLLLSLALVRFERVPDAVGRPAGANTPSRWGTTLAVILFVVAPLGISAYGLDLPLAVAGAALTATALGLVGAFRRG